MSDDPVEYDPFQLGRAVEGPLDERDSVLRTAGYVASCGLWLFVAACGCLWLLVAAAENGTSSPGMNDLDEIFSRSQKLELAGRRTVSRLIGTLNDNCRWLIHTSR